MNINFSIIRIFFILSVFTAPYTQAGSFNDSFESGDFSTTDANGFRWSPPNKTSIVSDSASKDGNYSMKFLYPAGEFWSEQRFDMGKIYPDLWMKYWIRVPVNFKHKRTNPSNNKFLAIWMDGYSQKGNGPTVIWVFWHANNGGSKLAVHVSEGGYRSTKAPQDFVDFINYPDDQGRWMKVVFHLKASTNKSSNNGVIETWRRWEDETKFTKLHNITNVNIAPPSNGPAGWKKGYLMGWSNPSYDKTTEWLLDDFTISDVRPAELDSSEIIPRPPVLKAIK